MAKGQQKSNREIKKPKQDKKDKPKAEAFEKGTSATVGAIKKK